MTGARTNTKFDVGPLNWFHVSSTSCFSLLEAAVVVASLGQTCTQLQKPGVQESRQCRLQSQTTLPFPHTKNFSSTGMLLRHMFVSGEHFLFHSSMILYVCARACRSLCVCLCTCCKCTRTSVLCETALNVFFLNVERVFM